jgi:hypothetical protein
MAYVIECHIVEEATDTQDPRIQTVVSFYGEDEADAQDAYDRYFEQNINLGKIAAEGHLLEEESEIPDDQLPELEIEDEDAPRK